MKSNKPCASWFALDLQCPPEHSEAIGFGLIEAGALGTETKDAECGQITVCGYFAHLPDLETTKTVLAEALRIYSFAPTSLTNARIREIADQDWLAEWKKHWRPVEVGRFIIAPPWSEASAPDDHLLIRINPGMAFGTGTHETTRLCLKAIEKYYAGGSFLDVGTGTGILAIAAAKLAPDASIIGCDTDAEAIGIARENERLNDLGNRIDFRVGTIDEEIPSADLVCANLTAPVIVELLPALLGVTCGRLVLSGILEAQFEMVHARLLEQAATVNEVMQDNEWLALVI